MTLSSFTQIAARPEPALSRFARRWLWPLRFALILLIPISMLDAYWLGRATGAINLFAYWPLFANYVLMTVIDYAVGRDESPPDANDSVLYTLIALAVVPAELAALVLSASIFDGFDAIGQLGWALSCGATSGAVAITAGHELIHRATRLERWCGGLLLSSVCYGGFKIEHVYGHHLNVATPLDASSARLGQSVYAFVPRSVFGNTLNAWRLASHQLRRRRLPWWRNEMLAWSACSAAFTALFFVLFGFSGVVFFVAQSAVAICELEIINYIQHYGLSRRPVESGYERVAPIHSWNSSYRLMKLFQLGLSRHSDHHASAARPYHALRHVENAPQLPGGYGAMLLLALVPPLWFRIIHPLIPRNTE